MQHQFLNIIDIQVIKKIRNLVYRIFILIDEDSQLLDEVTSRMAMDNIKTNRTMNDSRIRGLNKIINQFL